MSKFTDKVKAFFKDIEGDAVGAEQHVVAWFHSIFASHTSGTPIPPPLQAGATPPPAVVAAPVITPPTPGNAGVPVAHPPAVNSGAPPVQAGSVVPTPNPPAGATVVGAVPGAQASAAPVTGVPAADGSLIPGKMTPRVPPVTAVIDTDVPDAKGLVALVGLPAGNTFNGLRLAIDEIGLSLPAGSQARETCMNAVTAATSKYSIGAAHFIGVAFDSQEVDNTVTGGKDWALISPAVDIPNTVAFPALTIVTNGITYNTATVAGVVAYCLAMGAIPNVLPNPATTGGGGKGEGALARKAANANDTTNGSHV